MSCVYQSHVGGGGIEHLGDDEVDQGDEFVIGVIDLQLQWEMIVSYTFRAFPDHRCER